MFVYESKFDLSSFFESLVAVDAHFSSWAGSGALTPEARLFAVIAARGSLSVKEAMYDSALSNRAFYQLINRMKAAKKIKVIGDPSDGRVRRIIFDSRFLEAFPFAASDVKLIANAHFLIQKALEGKIQIKRLATG